MPVSLHAHVWREWMEPLLKCMFLVFSSFISPSSPSTSLFPSFLPTFLFSFFHHFLLPQHGQSWGPNSSLATSLVTQPIRSIFLGLARCLVNPFFVQIKPQVSCLPVTCLQSEERAECGKWLLKSHSEVTTDQGTQVSTEQHGAPQAFLNLDPWPKVELI